MAKINVQLTNGTIVEVKEDSYLTEGCPTCDFGKAYINNLSFTIKVDGYKDFIEVNFFSSKKDGFCEDLSVGNVVMLITDVIDKEASFDDFIELCRKKLNKNGELEMTISGLW